jgi:hypothetical protein
MPEGTEFTISADLVSVSGDGNFINVAPTTGAPVVSWVEGAVNSGQLAADVALTGAVQNIFAFNANFVGAGQRYRFETWLTLFDDQNNNVDVWISTQNGTTAGTIGASTTASIPIPAAASSGDVEPLALGGVWVPVYLGCYGGAASSQFVNVQAQNAHGLVKATTLIVPLSAPRASRWTVSRAV